jgi:23S rRNA (adenine2503-C2)-methyltransferase
MMTHKISENYKVPTGNICIMQGSKGKPLEFLSIGDYGKEKNIKADFMGLTKEINGVPHGDVLPLEKKWVITISSQYGCSMGCTFCDVPKVGSGINATYEDMIQQVLNAISLHPEVKATERLNLHYARMGEPTWNKDVIRSAKFLRTYLKSINFGFHPVVSTMMPKDNTKLKEFIEEWLILKREFNGEAGLQLSINTTDYVVRKETMPNSMNIMDIHTMMQEIINDVGGIRGRKITLNFALTEADIDSKYLRAMFDPRYFICKITPMHNTNACIKNGLITENGYDSYYPYQKIEKELKEAGFDVIIFIPSHEEDSSKITCGNVILARNK